MNIAARFRLWLWKGRKRKFLETKILEACFQVDLFNREIVFQTNTLEAVGDDQKENDQIKDQIRQLRESVDHFRKEISIARMQLQALKEYEPDTDL